MAFFRHLSVALICAVLANSTAAATPDTLVAATPLAGAPDGASAYRIHYRSQDEQGRRIVVTGMVVVPAGRAPAAGRDTVVWGHGSYGIAEKCAPLAGDLQFSTVAGLADLLGRGLVVAVPDYQGLGNPGPHPYLVGRASARTMLDAVRAARGVPRAQLSGRFATWGESQGAHAALWAATLAPRYAPELELVGAAAAAPPTDLKANMTGGSNAVVRAFLTAYTAESWHRVYGAPLSALGPRRTQRLIGRLANNNCIELSGFKLRTKIGLVALAGQLRGVDFSKPEPWRTLIARNTVVPARFPVPLFIAQEDNDPVVGAGITRRFVERSCRAGATLRFIAYPGGDHVGVGKRSAGSAAAWLGDRFAGKAAPSDCGRP